VSAFQRGFSLARPEFFRPAIPSLQSSDGKPDFGVCLRLLPSESRRGWSSRDQTEKWAGCACHHAHSRGSKDEIEKQLKTSLAAFFDIYPEI